MAARLWWEDLEVGRCFELGQYAVTREEVIEFAARYDPQPYHIDEAAAAANPVFGRLSASGVHTYAMTARLTFDGFARHGIVPIAGAGSDGLKFERPVYPGDLLSASIQIIESRELKSRPDRGLTRMRTEVENQHSEIVLSYESTLFFAKSV
jgi:acyl dehydratase